MAVGFETLLANALVATLLAAAVAALSLLRLRPAVMHVLWLIVLLKFVTPPLMRFELPSDFLWSPVPIAGDETDPEGTGDETIAANGAGDLPPGQPERAPSGGPSAVNLAASSLPAAEDDANVPTPEGAWQKMPALGPGEALADSGDAHKPAQSAGSGEIAAAVGGHSEKPAAVAAWQSLRPIALLATCWFIGSAVWFTLASIRLIRFHRLLRRTQAADPELQQLAREVAGRLGIRRQPILRVTQATLPPILVSLPWRGFILLPSELLCGLSRGQRAAVIAHELAHFRRGDHYVRWLELIVLGVYWWHPLAWWACRQLRQAEELCCDAWVLRVFPDQAKGYAQALLATVDFLAEVPALAPAGASGLGRFPPLQRRLEMIFKPAWRPDLSWAGRMALAAVALGVLAWTPRALAQDTKVPAGQEPPLTKQATPTLTVPPSSDTTVVAAKPTTEERLDRLETTLNRLIKALETKESTPSASISPGAVGAANRQVHAAEREVRAAELEQFKARIMAMDRQIADLEKQLTSVRKEREDLHAKFRKFFGAEGTSETVVVFEKTGTAPHTGLSPSEMAYDVDKESRVLVATETRTGKVVWMQKLDLGGVRSLQLDGDRLTILGERAKMTIDGLTGKVLSQPQPNSRQ